MTAPRRRIYDFIVQYKQAHDGCSPTIREIMQACDYKTTSAVYYILKRLTVEGLIELDPRNSRSIRIVGGQWHPPARRGVPPSAHTLVGGPESKLSGH